tara:strand:- start:247 stop:1416 length:1170 start_codon:yes stop_codon:yes gene_type:complete
MINRFSTIDMPFGAIAFGENVSALEVNHFVRKWLDSINDFTMILVLAGSRTAEIEGISWAGSTAESRSYTAIADAEFLLSGPLLRRKWPLPPLPAGISPALISYVCNSFIEISPMVLASGLEHEPPFPHLILDSSSLGPANCLSTGKAMNIDRVERLWDGAFAMGLQLNKPLLLAECVPGGTTTAQAVLTGLGLEVADFISSSVLNPPVELKKKLVEKGLKAACLGTKPLPKNLISAVGDPFQAIAVGLLLGARQSGQPVLLGGGSQMLAVLALALEHVKPAFRASFVAEIAIGTTAWLVEESNSSDQLQSSFLNLMKAVGDYFDVNLFGFASGLRFCESTKKVLRDYELGYVKEGVGAGAFAFLAQLKGVGINELVEACELVVDQLEK